MPLNVDYVSGHGLPAHALFDAERTRRLLEAKWFFVGTRGDVPNPGDVFTFSALEDEYFLLHSPDGQIRGFINRCAHQSARLFRGDTALCGASIVCPNHQWSYETASGRLHKATGMGRDYPTSPEGARSSLDTIAVREVGGLIFACLSSQPDTADMDEIAGILAPYTDPFALGAGGYKLAHHHREVVPANWLLVMINNRECMHCRANHKGLCDLFDPSSFNGAMTTRYRKLFDDAASRWQDLGLAWQEQAFEPNDMCRVARYPLQPGYSSITFDGAPASKRLIGPFESHDESTLSMWFNPNAWIHFTSDHIATNWVLPLDGDRCELYSSWLVRDDAVEGIDYDVEHLTEVWRVTNAEDVGLCESMTAGAKSRHYRPGPFSPDERFCIQFCDWFMQHSAQHV
nr:glycine betaine monooxygenase oxygenase subunit-like [Nerophis lumbriciformis]